MKIVYTTLILLLVSMRSIAADIDPPRLVSWHVFPSEVYTTSSSANVIVEMRIVDDESGTTMPVISAKSTTAEGQSTGFGFSTLISGTALDGVWKAQLTVPKGSAPGLWEISLFPLSDNQGNSGSFGPPAEFDDTFLVADSGGGNPGTGAVNLSGNVQNSDGTKLCALVLASGQYMFSCDPAGQFSLDNLPREPDGTVRRQIYADGFFPDVQDLDESGFETVILERAFNCPNYNLPSDPDSFPASAGKTHKISGRVLLQSTDTPLCALVLANGAYMFSCDDSGNYSLEFPLDQSGQYKLQVYANGFAPAVQKFNEFDNQSNVRMARSSECDIEIIEPSVKLYVNKIGPIGGASKEVSFPYSLSGVVSAQVSGIPTPTTYSLGTFSLTAQGQNFTITNLRATDSTGQVAPYFTELSNNYHLIDGNEVEFELVSPLTRGSTVNLNFHFEIKETGDTFSVSYTFTSN